MSLIPNTEKTKAVMPSPCQIFRLAQSKNAAARKISFFATKYGCKKILLQH
jgi:hypothetical protein